MDRIFHRWRRIPWDRRAMGIVALYMLVGGLWILWSDRLAADFAGGNQQILTQISIYKGWVYVLVTGLLLYWLVHANNRSLRAINRNYVLLAENISDVVWVLDLDAGRFAYISPSVQHLRGMTPEEALREPPQQALLPDSWNHIASVLPGRIEEFKSGVNKTHVDVLAQPCKDGSVVWVEVTSRFVVNEENGHLEVYAASRGITKRRQAEKALRESQSMLSMAEEVAETGSWRWDLATQKVTWSEQMFRLFGVEPEGFDGDVNRVIMERIHPDDVAAVQEANRKVLEEANPVPMTYRICLPDGTERIVWAQGRLVADDLDTPVALVGYAQDITERVRTEKKILQMQRLYATLSQVNQTIVRVQDPLELYRSICHLAVKYGEFTLAWVGLLDEASGDILPVAASGLDLEHWPFPIININEERFSTHLTSLAVRTSSLQTSEDIQSDTRLSAMRPSLQGRPFHALAVVPLKRGGRTIGVLAIISSEVGFFKAREEQLLLEEMGMDISFALNNIDNEKVKRQWADAFEHCAHGIVIELPSGSILTCNPAFASRQGYAIDEIASRPILEMYAAEDREQVTAWLVEADRSGHAQYEAHMVRKDGRAYPVQMDVVSVRDEAENLLYRVTTQQDITSRKRAEQIQREMELRFSRIFQSSPVAINIFWLSDGRSLDVNDAFLELTGYSREEVLSRTAAELGLFVDDEARTGWMERLRNGQRVTNQDARIFRKTGEIRDALVSLERIEINGEPMVLVLATDITDRKRAEQALRDSEDKFKYVFDHSPVGKSITTLDGHLSVNQTFADMLGYSIEELQGRRWQELTHPDDVELNRRELEPVLDGEKETARLVKRYLHKNGSIVWVDLSTSLRRAPDGKPLYFISAVIDITERKRAENALRESEYQLRALVTSLDDIVLELDEDGVYRNIWTADESLLVRPRAQLLGQSMPKILGGETGRLFKEAIPRVLASGTPESIEYPLEIMGGQYWFLARINPIKFGSDAPRTVSLLVRDVTDRKMAEEARRASEARFATVFNASPLAIAITSIRDNRLLDVNPAWQTITGWTKEEVVGNSPLELNLWADASERERMIQTMADKEMVQGFEMKSRKKSGEIVNLLMSAEFITLAGERCMLSVAQDITARKRAEAALQEAEEKYRNIFENAMEAITQTTPGGQYITANPATARILGYDSPESLIADISDLAGQFYVQPGRREEFKQLMDTYGLVTDFESEVYRKDGSRIWISENSRAIRDEHGKLLYYEGTAQDVTERRRAEQEIQIRNADLSLINALNDVVNRGKDLNSILEVLTSGIRDTFSAQDTTLYLLSPDGQYLEMQGSTLPKNMAGQIEKLIGMSIPRIRIPLSEAAYLRKLLSNPQGSIVNDPQDVQQWIREFSETVFLPKTLRSVIQKLIVPIYNLLKVRSILSIPLISSDRTIGQMDISSRGSFTAEDLERARTISRQVTAVILRKQAEERAQLQLRRLRALNEIDRAINASLDMRLSLDILLSEVLSELNVDAASVLLLSPISQMLEYVAGKGFRFPYVKESRIRIGEGLPGQVGLERRPLHVFSPEGVDDRVRRVELFKEEQFVEYFGVPLVSKGVLKGVLEVFHRTPLSPDPNWVRFLETLGEQAAIAVNNAQLFEDIQKSHLELITAYDATIAGWSRAMDLRDKETEGHSQRVTELTLQLAQRMGMNEIELQYVRRGSLLHDIGKLGVPDHILFKPGKFTEEEWEIMRRHPTYAHEMLSPIDYLRPAIDIPYCHHEKWDGTGYPRGLAGEQIPLAARLFAVVDVWDALRSDRPYRPGWSSEQARTYIIEQSGKHFDPRVVVAFLEMIEEA